MSERSLLVFVALSGFFYVAFGAFGAHVFTTFLSVEKINWIQTGLQYQAFHSVVLMILVTNSRYQVHFVWRLSGYFLLAGILLFSGSLYLLALANNMMWVYITPVGGSCFLIGWLLMFASLISCSKSKHNE